MGDVKDGRAQTLLDHADLQQHLFTQLRVQIGDWFVHYHHIRVRHQCTGDRHALLLSAGKLGGQMVGIFRHPDLLQGMHCPLMDLILRTPLFLQRIRYIFDHGHVRPDRIILKDDADVALFSRDVDAFFGIEQHLVADSDASGLRLVQPQQGTYKGRLAAAARAHQTDDLSALHLKAEVLQDHMVAVTNRNVLKAYVCHMYFLLKQLGVRSRGSGM